MRHSCIVVSVFFAMILAVEGQLAYQVTNDVECPPADENPTSVCSERVFPETECDMDICGKDQMCKEYHEIANKLNFRRYKSDLAGMANRTVTHMSNARTGLTIQYYENIPNTYGSQVECTGNNASLCDRFQNSSSASEHNFSPWSYMINFDENRLPQEILETKCTFKYCLSQTRTTTSKRYRSIPLMVTRYFRMRGNGSTIFNAQFSYGCICEYNLRYPNYLSAPSNTQT